MTYIARRLQRLEKRFPAQPPVRTEPSGAEHIATWLASKGIARGAHESLIEAFARVLGVAVQALCVYLQRRAAGVVAGLPSQERM